MKHIKVSNKACVDVTDKFIDLLVLGLMIGIFGALVLTMLSFGASSIATYATAKQVELSEADPTNASILYQLYGMLGSQAIIEVLFVAVFLLIIVFIGVGYIKKAKNTK